MLRGNAPPQGVHGLAAVPMGWAVAFMQQKGKPITRNIQ